MSDSTESQSSAVPEIPQHYRISVPIGTDMLPKEDWIQTNELIKSLKSHDVFADDVELQHRETVVKRLNSLFKEWLQDMCIEMNVPENVTDNVGYRLLPFGSYGLGAFSKGADIDALCVGPVFLDRTVFFTSFFEKIKAQEEAKDIQAIGKAFVPVINLTFDGIEVDLVYAQMPRRSPSDTLNLLDDMWLKDMDKASARSLNGYRVTEEILRLVPNVSNFRLALIAIKLWAKRRNIYSSKLGFLGGVSWAILVARICQFNPNMTASSLVMKFFRVYSMWEWPIPIRLRVVQDLNYNLPFWDSTCHRRDHYHLMPILTPAYPQQNTAFNVSLSSLAILVEEFNRGHTIVQEIQQHKADWFKLFETPHFMDKYWDYLQVEATSATEEQHLDWVGLVESRIRHLVGALWKHQCITLAHVNVQPYSPPEEALSTKWVIGFTLTDEYKKMRNKNDIDLTCEVRNFTDAVYNLAKTSGVFQKGMVVSVNYEKREAVAKSANVPPSHTADKESSVTSRPSKAPPASTAPQATKRPRSPSPGTSSKKFRPEEKQAQGLKPTCTKTSTTGDLTTKRIVRLVSRPGFSAPTAPQATKRPRSPSPGTSSKKFRPEEKQAQGLKPTCTKTSTTGDLNTKRIVRVVSRPGFSAPTAPQATKRPRSPSPGTSSKKFRPEEKQAQGLEPTCTKNTTTGDLATKRIVRLVSRPGFSAPTARQATKRPRSPSAEPSSKKFKPEEKGVKEAKTTSLGKSPAGISPGETPSRTVSPPSEDGAGTPDIESPAKTSNINLTPPPDELSDLPNELSRP